MIKKQIVIDIELANEWQERLHYEPLIQILDVWETKMTNGLSGYPQCKNKNNKLEYSVFDVHKKSGYVQRNFADAMKKADKS